MPARALPERRGATLGVRAGRGGGCGSRRRGPLVTTSTSLLMQAALDGVGFLQTFDGAVAEHLAAGRLVSVLDDWSGSRFPDRGRISIRAVATRPRL